MDQFIVTLEPGADKVLLRKMIKNIRGISDVILKRETLSSPKNKAEKKINQETEDWIREMKELSNSFDSTRIDLNDERTRYILKI